MSSRRWWQIFREAKATRPSACGVAYGGNHLDPVTRLPYVSEPTQAENGALGFTGYPGFDPLAGTASDPYVGQNTFDGHDYGPAPNNGEGFAKDLGGNKLPNAPPFTVSFSAEYSLPLSAEWAGTLHGDYYWQDYSW